MKDASSLYKLIKDAPPDGEFARPAGHERFRAADRRALGRRLLQRHCHDRDRRPALTIASSDIAAFARAAESYRNRAVVPIAIKVEPGPLFKLGSIRVLSAAGVEFSKAELPARIVGLGPGDPAAASDLRAAQARIVDYFRSQGRPLAKIQSIAPVVDHAAHSMDVTLAVDLGPVCAVSAKRR